MKQLVSNVVRVRFWAPGKQQPDSVARFDLVQERDRHRLGARVAAHLCTEPGARVETEVLTVARSQ